MLSRTSEMLPRESDLWAAGQIASGSQAQFAGCAGSVRRPCGRDPLEIVVERALVATFGLEQRRADRVSFPDLDVPGFLVHDHPDADARNKTRCVVASTAAYIDPMLVNARERDKAHVDALKLRAAGPLKATAEIRQDRLLNRSVTGECGPARNRGDHGGCKKAGPYRAFELDALHDQVASARMITEYMAIVAASRRSPD